MCQSAVAAPAPTSLSVTSTRRPAAQPEWLADPASDRCIASAGVPPRSRPRRGSRATAPHARARTKRVRPCSRSGRGYFSEREPCFLRLHTDRRGLGCHANRSFTLLSTGRSHAIVGGARRSRRPGCDQEPLGCGLFAIGGNRVLRPRPLRCRYANEDDNVAGTSNLTGTKELG